MPCECLRFPIPPPPLGLALSLCVPRSLLKGRVGRGLPGGVGIVAGASECSRRSFERCLCPGLFPCP